MDHTGAQILIQSLIDQGVNVLFGYPGGAVLNIYDALYERAGDIRHILASHEQGACHAADGYARSTGRTDVVLATSGPGAVPSASWTSATTSLPHRVLGRPTTTTS